MQVDTGTEELTSVPFSPNYILIPTEIDFPARALDYGQYSFQVNISMDGEPEIYTADSVKINIVKSPLEVHFPQNTYRHQ